MSSVTATAKRRRRQARNDKRYQPKGSIGKIERRISWKGKRT